VILLYYLLLSGLAAFVELIHFLIELSGLRAL